jgi:hypothetical protein
MAELPQNISSLSMLESPAYEPVPAGCFTSSHLPVIRARLESLLERDRTSHFGQDGFQHDALNETPCKVGAKRLAGAKLQWIHPVNLDPSALERCGLFSPPCAEITHSMRYIRTIHSLRVPIFSRPFAVTAGQRCPAGRVACHHLCHGDVTIT